MSRKALFKKHPKKLTLENGESVWVRSFTVAELLHVESLRDQQKNEEALTYTVRRCCVDEQGERVLSDDEAIDEMPLETMREVVEAVNKLSAGGSIQKIEKNSDATG